MENSIQAANQAPIKKIRSKTDIINALKTDFATTVRRIYVNSLNKEIGFREINVKEQKTVSRIMIDNESRKDVVYDTQCALINQVALDEGFDIYQLTEFDKIKLLMALYETNVFKNEIKFTCTECGTDNKYKMDFRNAIARLNDLDIGDKTFTFENATWKFDFVVGYPTVRRISDFYKSYILKYHKLKGKELDSLNSSIDMDYVDMFIKTITITKLADGTVNEVNLDEFTPAEAVEIVSTFPQDVLYTTDGILSYISENFIAVINKQFDKHKCATCGHIHGEALDTSTAGFF